MIDQVLLNGSDYIDDFLFAGKAVFTIRNPVTNKSFTFKIKASRSGMVHFVSVLTGCNNESDYTYIGYISNGQFKYGKGKSPIGNDAPSVRAFSWFMRNRGNLGSVECYRSNNCARCGRKLTVASSVLAFLGPECAKRIA